MLLSKFYKEEKTLLQAIQKSFKTVTGNSAFVILARKEKKIYAVKKSAPLVCGINKEKNEVFVSSDPYALVGKAQHIFFPDDEIFCELDGENTEINFYDIEGNKSAKYLKQEQVGTYDVAEKGPFEHFMLKEIFEQPQLIRDLANYYVGKEGKEMLAELRKLKGKYIHISACGTAYHAGLMIRNYLEKYNNLPTTVELASEFRYKHQLIQKDDLGLFISQSGETADTLAAQRLCKERGLDTIALVNVKGSTLYRDCTKNLLTRAGVEIGVCSTKAFTMQVLTGYLGTKKLSDDFDEVEIGRAFSLLADRIDDLLKRSKEIEEIAKKIYNKKGFLFTGRGNYYPIALEGALKLKEIAYVHAEGYAAGELKHGPIALIDEEMVNIAIIGPELYDKTFSNIQEVKAREGVIVALGPKDDKNLKDLADYYIGFELDGLGDLSPLLVNVGNQLLSYYMAKFKGTDIDKPRNLAKSVTVE